MGIQSSEYTGIKLVLQRKFNTSTNVYQLISNNKAENEKQLPMKALGHLAKINTMKNAEASGQSYRHS